MTIEDITGHIRAKQANTVMEELVHVLDKHEFSRAEMLGMLDLVKMNLYTIWQFEDGLEQEDDHD